MLNSIIPEAENNFITVSTYSTVSLCLRRDPAGSAATEGQQAAGLRGVKRGEEEGGRRWVGRRVSELMTVLSAGAERAETERASVFSTTSLSLPELKGTEKGCIVPKSDGLQR